MSGMNIYVEHACIHHYGNITFPHSTPLVYSFPPWLQPFIFLYFIFVSRSTEIIIKAELVMKSPQLKLIIGTTIQDLDHLLSVMYRVHIRHLKRWGKQSWITHLWIIEIWEDINTLYVILWKMNIRLLVLFTFLASLLDLFLNSCKMLV